MGLGGEDDAGQIERDGESFCAADCDDGSGFEGGEGEHVVVRRGWSAGGAGGANVDQRAL